MGSLLNSTTTVMKIIPLISLATVSAQTQIGDLGDVSQFVAVSDRNNVPGYAIKMGLLKDKKIAANVKNDGYNMATQYTLFKLQNYGCWCRGYGWPQGKGEAVDVFDEICRKQHHNYDCLEMEDPTCSPASQHYDLQMWMVGRHVWVSCVNDPVTEPCKAKTCMIDIQIVKDYVAEANQMNFPMMSEFGHQQMGYGAFDPEVSCPRGDNSNREKECCGSYPHREWFLRNDDIGFRTRECCEYNDQVVQNDWNDPNMKVGRYYDSSIETCCADGVSVIGGRC